MPIDYQTGTAGAQIDRVAEDTSKAASSFNMLEQHLQNPSQRLDLGYEPIFGAIRPVCEHSLPLINELTTATDFESGEFHTIDNSYYIFREDIDTRITTFDGETTLLEFWEPSAFQTSEGALSFLRSMKSNLINNVDPKTLTSHFNILRIIAQATVELVLARYAQLHGGNKNYVEIDLSAKSKLDQSVEIELGHHGDQPTGVNIPTDTLIISTGYNDVITGPYVRIEERLRVPSLTMANLHVQSAELTFATLGLHDLSKLLAEIDEWFESY